MNLEFLILHCNFYFVFCHIMKLFSYKYFIFIINLVASIYIIIDTIEISKVNNIKFILYPPKK